MTAFLVYVTANAIILSFCGETPLAMHLPGSMAAWTAQYSQQRKPPDVVLLGSSVMRTPLIACDKANYGVSDCIEYCQSRELTNQLSSNKRLFTVFNAARDGLMVTDALLIEDKLLREPLLPKVLVYGVSPRDFVDSLLDSERATETFQYYFGLSNAIRFGESFSSSWQERIELILGEVIPLYSARKTIVTAIAQRITCAYPKANVLQQQNSHSNEEANTKRLQTLMSDAEKDSELAFMSIAVQRNTEAVLAKTTDETKTWRASIWQYTMRYFALDRKRFGRQSRAFTNVLKMAKERDIKILVLNMPLASDNLALLPHGFYQAYLRTIRESCNEQRVAFLDLQPDLAFTRTKFEDVAHLNSSGGNVLIARLVPIILQLLKTSPKTNVGLPPGANEFSVN